MERGGDGREGGKVGVGGEVKGREERERDDRGRGEKGREGGGKEKGRTTAIPNFLGPRWG